MVYDDYGHHPTEIQATLDALKKKYPTHKLYVFFQPHLFSRTKLFLDSFAEVLAAAHHVYCMPIYAAREALDETISSDTLVNAIRSRGGSAELLMSKDMMPSVIDSLDEKQSIAVNIGAGDAYVELDKLSLQ
jgi:UDP-N-acetylmuramate--alanine ligase